MSGYLHATAVVVGEKGLLLIGASGAGKSSLAERIIAEARAAGRFAGLVGDDRVWVEARGGRLVASAHPALRGQIERRGIGIERVDPVASTIVHGVISIEPNPPRLPEPESLIWTHLGVRLPLQTLRSDQDLAAKAHLALAWIGA